MRWENYPNFSEKELACTFTGRCFMTEHFMGKLQELRDAYGKPLIITSGFRDPKHPIEEAKSRPGVHTRGLAVDIACDGQEAYKLVKAMGDLQQWSFGFQVDDAEEGQFTKDGQSTNVRYIKSATVYEVSPVLVGANQLTHTLSVKEQKEQDVKNVESGLRFTDEAKSVLNTIDSFIDRAKELTSLRLEKGKMLSKSAQDSLMQIQDRIQEVYNDLDSILGLGTEQEEAKQPSDELDKLWLTTQEVLAQSQGITIEGEKE